MRIVQILTVLAYGDAIGNHVLSLREAFLREGYQTKIFAEAVDSRLPKGIAENYQLYREKKDDIILYHLAIGTELNYKVTNHKCRIIINYHNITPPHYFAGYDSQGEMSCTSGLMEARYLANKVFSCIADSEYNKRDLIQMGYQCDIKVLPILLAFDDYKKKPDTATIKKYKDGYTNIIFVGRIVPNKAQHDIINAFAHYKKYFNAKARLILVGTYGGMEKYYNQLQAYANQLGVNDIVYPGHINFSQVLAFYKCADLFLCQSDHEGFGVPLLEAMIFGVPIIAYDSSAVGETLGGAGFLLSEKSPLYTAGAINRVLQDQFLREQIIQNGFERLKFFDSQILAKKFVEYIITQYEKI